MWGEGRPVSCRARPWCWASLGTFHLRRFPANTIFAGSPSLTFLVRYYRERDYGRCCTFLGVKESFLLSDEIIYLTSCSGKPVCDILEQQDPC